MELEAQSTHSAAPAVCHCRQPDTVRPPDSASTRGSSPGARRARSKASRSSSLRLPLSILQGRQSSVRAIKTTHTWPGESSLVIVALPFSFWLFFPWAVKHRNIVIFTSALPNPCLPRCLLDLGLRSRGRVSLPSPSTNLAIYIPVTLRHQRRPPRPLRRPRL